MQIMPTDLYQSINLDDYTRTGEGATAVAYTHKTELRLAKLYNKGFEADEALREFSIAKTVFAMGIPSPEPYRLVTDGERLGAEYELIPGKKSFSRLIANDPSLMRPLTLRFAGLSKDLHRMKADTSALPSFREMLREFLPEVAIGPGLSARESLCIPGHRSGHPDMPPRRPSDRESYHRRKAGTLDRPGTVLLRRSRMGHCSALDFHQSSGRRQAEGPFPSGQGPNAGALGHLFKGLLRDRES
jgi:hypothetical protein